MSTSRTRPVSPTPKPRAGPTPSVRLAVSPTGARGHLDGAWWPRTRNLAGELPALIEVLPESMRHIRQASYSPPDWDTATRVITHPGGRFRAGRFHQDHAHALMIRTSARMFTFLVIPPETPTRQAHAALRWGASAANVETPNEILMVLAGEDAESSAHWDVRGR